jgi:hypothetical protein
LEKAGSFLYLSMNKVYREEPVSLKKRLLHPVDTIIGNTLSTTVLATALYNSPFVNYWYMWVILSVYVMIMVCFSLVKPAMQYYHEVEIEDEHIIFRGQHINKAIGYKFKIKNVDISLVVTRSRTYNHIYYLKFTSGRYIFTYNKYFNWEELALLDLFNDFKIAKGEKITWDEKYLLNDLQ